MKRERPHYLSYRSERRNSVAKRKDRRKIAKTLSEKRVLENNSEVENTLRGGHVRLHRKKKGGGTVGARIPENREVTEGVFQEAKKRTR